ncbi:MAG TPA: hypothetical protein VMY77_16230, partial [Chitinophagaceae bacterium]|nr:hypothetical protein [Chitinophagaceae bacterium]
SLCNTHNKLKANYGFENYKSWKTSKKKISEAIITMNHMAIRNESNGCLKLLAANIMAIMQQAIEIKVITL